MTVDELGAPPILGSTLVRNSASRVGGAIRQRWNTIRITSSTLADNSARLDGGTIENYFATVELINSTISGNSAGGVGGAIDNWGGTVTSTNSTIVKNRADADGNGSGAGGGIYSYSTSSITLLNNTPLAGNLLGGAGSDSPNDMAGVNIDPASSHNLIGEAAKAGGLLHGANGNIVGNAGTGTIDIAIVIDSNLVDNGGPTQTHALVRGSLSVNAGDKRVRLRCVGRGPLGLYPPKNACRVLIWRCTRRGAAVTPEITFELPARMILRISVESIPQEVPLRARGGNSRARVPAGTPLRCFAVEVYRGSNQSRQPSRERIQREVDATRRGIRRGVPPDE